MPVFLMVLTGYLFYNGLACLSQPSFRGMVERHAVEIIYISLSCTIVVLFGMPPGTTLLLASMLVLYEGGRSAFGAIGRERDQIVLYQIFSYINNQMRAGLRIEDILVGLYQVVPEKQKREGIRKLGWVYANNYDLDRYLQGLGEWFAAEEFTAIEYAVRNSVIIGFNENVMTFQEEMMFNRYIGVIRKRGDRGKLKLLLAGILLSLVFFIQIGYPFYLEFMISLETLY